MKPRISMVTLGVSDLARSIRFYEEGLGFPRMPLEANVAFFPLTGTWLALFGREDLARDANVVFGGPGPASIALAHNVASREEADRVMQLAMDAGARLVKRLQEAEWGGYSGYFADPDGHLWEIAWNPHLQVGPQDDHDG